jgi:hypothetical protein
MVSSDGCSPSSGFPNCPMPQPQQFSVNSDTSHSRLNISTPFKGAVSSQLNSIQRKIYVMINHQIASRSWGQHPSEAHDQLFVTVRQLRVSWCGGTLSDEGMDLYLTVAAGPCQHCLRGSISCGIYNCILLFQIRDSPQPGGPGSHTYFPQEYGSQFIPPDSGCFVQ